ncbi:MAG: hypothetical protein IJB98_03655 [Clostridia bacterium]|nr:hypothetical protein [Clostridia bacterium]
MQKFSNLTGSNGNVGKIASLDKDVIYLRYSQAVAEESRKMSERIKFSIERNKQLREQNVLANVKGACHNE